MTGMKLPRAQLVNRLAAEFYAAADAVPGTATLSQVGSVTHITHVAPLSIITCLALLCLALPLLPNTHPLFLFHPLFIPFFFLQEEVLLWSESHRCPVNVLSAYYTVDGAQFRVERVRFIEAVSGASALVTSICVLCALRTRFSRSICNFFYTLLCSVSYWNRRGAKMQ
jgi:hypothetical protein